MWIKLDILIYSTLDKELGYTTVTFSTEKKKSQGFFKIFYTAHIALRELTVCMQIELDIIYIQLYT